MWVSFASSKCDRSLTFEGQGHQCAGRFSSTWRRRANYRNSAAKVSNHDFGCHIFYGIQYFPTRFCRPGDWIESNWRDPTSLRGNLLIKEIAKYYTMSQCACNVKICISTSQMMTSIGNYNRGFLWDVIIHPCSNFSSGLAKSPLQLRHGWISISHFMWMCLELNAGLTQILRASFTKMG